MNQNSLFYLSTVIVLSNTRSKIESSYVYLRVYSSYLDIETHTIKLGLFAVDEGKNLRFQNLMNKMNNTRKDKSFEITYRAVFDLLSIFLLINNTNNNKVT